MIDVKELGALAPEMDPLPAPRKSEAPLPDSAAGAQSDTVLIMVDHATVDPFGRLRVGGWILARTPLREVTVHAGEQLLGTAKHGLERQDVANRFPGFPHALKSGFLLIADGGRKLPKGAILHVRAADTDGAPGEAQVPVKHDVPDAALRDRLAASSDPNFQVVAFGDEAGNGRAAAAPISGFIDFYGFHNTAGGWLFCGWFARSSREEFEVVRAVVKFDRGETSGEAAAALYFRDDVADHGHGVVLFVKGSHRPLGGLVSVVFESATDEYRMDPGSQAQHNRDHDLVARLRPIVQGGWAGKSRDFISRYLARQPYNGSNTLPQLTDKVAIEVDDAVLCGESGVILTGWALIKPQVIEKIDVRCGPLTTPFDLSQCIRIERPDVMQAVGPDHGYDDTRCGFVAYLPDAVIPASPVYFEIETRLGETAFKPIPLPKPEGISAMKRILSGFNVRFNEVAPAFQHIGPAVTILNRQRLATRPGVHKRNFGPPVRNPRVSVIVPLYGRIDFLEYQLAFFSSCENTADYEFIYVLDDPPKRRETEYLLTSAYERFKIPLTAVFLEKNLGFAPANNVGLGYATGEYICFLNSDVFPGTVDWIDRLVDRLEDKSLNLGTVGPLLLFEDGSVQHEGIVFRELPEFGGWFFPDHQRKGMRPPEESGIRYHHCITGACMVMRRTLAQEMGGFDEVFLIGDFEDTDLCFKIKQKGLRCAVDLDVHLFHLERKSQIGSAVNWRMNTTLYNAWVHQGRWARTIEELVTR